MKISSDYKPSAGFGLLLQSPPKAGKTTLALQFPEPYIADCDNNLSGALRWMRENRPDQLPHIRYDTINVLDDGTIVDDKDRWGRLLGCLNDALKDASIRTIIVDSVSALSKYLEDFVISKKGTGTDATKMTISDWIPFRNLMSKLVVDLRSKAAGRSIIFTSHEEPVKDEATGVIHFRTNMPSKLADSFGGFFSDVWRCEVDQANDKVIYRVRAIQTSRYPALGSSLALPATFTFGKEFYDKVIAPGGQAK